MCYGSTRGTKMKFNLKKLLQTKEMKIIGLAALGNFALVTLVSGMAFDIIGLIAYLIIALGIGYILHQKKMKIMDYALIGFLAPLAFNFLFSVLGFFPFDLMLSLKAGVQQGVITAIAAKVGGVQ